MAIWYMVKRLDTGEINGIDTWFHGLIEGVYAETGNVDVQRFKDGTPHHLTVLVHAESEEEARSTAGFFFDLEMQQELKSRCVATEPGAPAEG